MFPATEVSARPCWFIPLVSFKNIYHLDGVSDGWLLSGNNFEVFRKFLSLFLATEYEKVLILYASKNKWELYQNL